MTMTFSRCTKYISCTTYPAQVIIKTIDNDHDNDRDVVISSFSAIAMSCDANRCFPNAEFSDMLRDEALPTARVLSLVVHGVSEASAGRYRCQAQAVSNSLTVEGKCSFRFRNNGTDCFPLNRFLWPFPNIYFLFIPSLLPHTHMQTSHTHKATQRCTHKRTLTHTDRDTHRYTPHHIHHHTTPHIDRETRMKETENK